MQRCLIADDDPTIVLLLEHVLEGLGWPFDVADDGATAWSRWNETRHDLVILDIEMPGMDGLEVCRRIRAAEKERVAYILVVTGRDKASDLEAVLEAGADDYVGKPTTGQRLRARMRIAQRRMHNDRARREAEEQLRASRFHEGIGQATVGLQHEINNPLTGLLGTAELMLLDAEARGEPTGDLRTIIEQAQRIRELVKRIGDPRDARTVEYTAGRRMVDLTGDTPEKE